LIIVVYLYIVCCNCSRKKYSEALQQSKLIEICKDLAGRQYFHGADPGIVGSLSLKFKKVLGTIHKLIINIFKPSDIQK
jgi:hypothetical protein